MSDTPISVVVVDDHPLFRRGVVELLNDSEEMTVIAEYDNAEALLDNIENTYPDILLLDMQMPGKSGLGVLKQLREHDNQLKIIIITACNEQDKLLEALRYGANGYLQKDTPPDEILSQLMSVLHGNVAMNAGAVTSLASHLRENKDDENNPSSAILSHMTERERETLFYIAKGLNNKLIARELGISDGTVKVYVKSLLRKVNLHSRLELAAWAHRNLSAELLDKEV
ncbi:nitrate/nitrite response regulator protein [Methylophaga aminisulfidivorans MP]|uniref:Nitrate/nitrite response regulator protein n=2 Tax=Methylophaga aminisulfidivorans TaxID=230105 RepID=F5SYD1_9GAMM|nr:response regulator [Methylophaga aminisulfidivorans]AAW21508.1 nitrate/nitrite regulatory protein [Methylophaga aminisulfidivorans MP]EGL54176.1 nitrate/nitrite response regulator protein [Methylophaga aminisulfidivorans MP]